MGAEGFEPPTICLRGNCSTTELCARVVNCLVSVCRIFISWFHFLTNSSHQEIFFPDLISRNALVSSPHPDERIARDRQSSMAVGRWCIDTCQHYVQPAAFLDCRYCQYTGYHGLYFLAHKRRTYSARSALCLMVGREGFLAGGECASGAEPPTICLRGNCSTTELCARIRFATFRLAQGHLEYY